MESRASCAIAAIPSRKLAENSDFLEVAHLVYYGWLPTVDEKKEFDYEIMHHTMLNEQIIRFFNGFRRDSHPMAVMCGVVGALSAFYHDHLDINNPTDRMIASYRLISKMPTIAAYAYKYSQGQPFVYPCNRLNYAENFLRMTFATPCDDYEVNPILAKALDRLFILHCRPRAERLDLDRTHGRVRAKPIRSPASRPVSPRCGARRMAARTKPCSTC